MNPPEINNLDPQDDIPKFETKSSNINNINNTNNDFNSSNGAQNIPNSVAVLVLGILSICFCWCYGILSIIMGIIAIVMAGTAEKEYKLNMHKYSLASYKNLKAGKICAIIGLCLSALYIILLVIYFVVFGAMLFGASKFGWH
ncbi:MAG: CCC motif membrane protein [Bacteroidia bacterium]